MSKGSERRPASVDEATMEQRWRDTFGQTTGRPRPQPPSDPTTSTHDEPVRESGR